MPTQRPTRDRYGRVTMTPVRSAPSDVPTVRPWLSPAVDERSTAAYATSIRGVYGDPRTTHATNAELIGRPPAVSPLVGRCRTVVLAARAMDSHPCGLLVAPGEPTCVLHRSRVTSPADHLAVNASPLPIAVIDVGTLERVRAYVTRHDFADVGTDMSELHMWQDETTAYATHASRETPERVSWCVDCGHVVGMDGSGDDTCQHARTNGAALPGRLDGPRADHPDTYRYAVNGTGGNVAVDATPALWERDEAAHKGYLHAWTVDGRSVPRSFADQVTADGTPFRVGRGGRYVPAYRFTRGTKLPRRSTPGRGVVRVGRLTMIGRWRLAQRHLIATDVTGRYGIRTYRVRGSFGPIGGLMVDSFDRRPPWQPCDVQWTGTRTAKGKARRMRVTATTVAKSRATRAANKSARVAAMRDRLPIG